MGSAAVGDTYDTMADTGCDMSEEELLAMLRGIDASKIQSESQVVYPEKTAQAEEKDQVGWVPTIHDRGPISNRRRRGRAAEQRRRRRRRRRHCHATARRTPPSSRRIACRRPPRRRI